MARLPYTVDPEYTGLAISYRNGLMIADRVLPRVLVGQEDFYYQLMTKSERFTIPDTAIGRKGVANQVEFSGTRTQSYTLDRGLGYTVPQKDIDNAPVGYDPVAYHVELTTELIVLDREKRVADLIFDADTYPAANKVQLSGNHQWDEYAQTDSDPIEDIMTGLESCMIRPNLMAIGRAPWSKLARHPEIVKAVNGNSGDSGIARRQQVAELFELEEILVGEGWYNSSQEGQTASYSRLWGNHCALLYVPMNPKPEQMTFGFTAQYGERVVKTAFDDSIGLDGAAVGIIGEKVREVISASDQGYFLEDVI
jgi:hypothetical protein